MDVRGRIDEIRFIDPLSRNLDRPGIGNVPEGASAYVRGWGFLSNPRRAARGASARIDGAHAFALAYNQLRPDVAREHQLDDLQAVGFHGVWSLDGVATGPHCLQVALAGESGEETPLESEIRFRIVDGALAFPPGIRRDDDALATNVDGFDLGLRRFDIFALGELRTQEEIDNGPVFARGDIAVIRGWAVDRAAGTAASDVFVVIDGTVLRRGVVGGIRPDIVQHLQSERVARSGYLVRFDTQPFAPGRHVAEVRLISADGDRYTVRTLPFEVR